MYYYLFKNKLVLSKKTIDYFNFREVNESYCENYKDTIFLLNPMPIGISRRSFIVSSPSMCFLDKEDLTVLSSLAKTSLSMLPLPSWLETAIFESRVISLNSNYPGFEEVITYTPPEKWKINLVGLGDVGATLLTGLKLLGSDSICSLGIYDLDENKIKRIKLELSQILSCDGKEKHLEIRSLQKNELFNCDMFIFCVSVGVPPIGKEGEDVRLSQFHGNRKVLEYYGELAREANYKGIFSIVSDPVDLLCKALFHHSNKNFQGVMDYKGLSPEQIRGYGLGVMNARAVYYSSLKENTKNYSKEGRAFGPHGEGLVIANSIENYDDEASEFLTNKTKRANLEIRSSGFKPYIAPALSSGTLSILDTIKGNYHYSSNFLGGTFMGCKNRFLHGCTENELLPIPEVLMVKLHNTYNLLNDLYLTY